MLEREGANPLFFSEPSYSAPNLQASPKASFEITDVVEGPDQRLYYRLQFSSGKEGYIGVDSFMENLNSSLVAQDPDLKQRKKLADEEQAESQRVEQIRAQPWPESVKQAAIKRQPTVGMRTGDVTLVLGKPKRITRSSQSKSGVSGQEQWTYEHGPVLIFTDGVLTQIQGPAPTKPWSGYVVVKMS